MLSDIPDDVFLQICKSCSNWRDVISLRRVCYKWNRFFKQREIWAHLVSAFLDQPSSPKLHYTERPIYTCSAQDLEKVYKRWKMAEMGWKLPEKKSPDVKQLDLDPCYLAKASILAPGGRWLIIFTNLVRAFCFDLDSESPDPIAIIPTQFNSKRDLLPERAEYSSDELDDIVNVEVSQPEVDPTAEYLSFHVVVTYVAWPFNSTVQVWKFDAEFDNATGRSSIAAHISWTFSPEYGFLRCRSFLGNTLVVEAPDMDVGPGLPSDMSKFLICNWREAKEYPREFPLRVLFTYKSVEQVQLLRDGHILLYSFEEGLVLCHYASIPIYTGPRRWGRIMSLYLDIKKVLSLDFYYLISKPYYMEGSKEDTNIRDDIIPAGFIVLCNDVGHVHEMRIEAGIDIQHTCMAPIWYLGAIPMPREDSQSEEASGVRSDEKHSENFKVCLGYSHAACIAQSHLKLTTYWRRHANEGEPIVKETGIMALDSAGLQIDEGSGRIVISEDEQNRIQIVDIAV